MEADRTELTNLVEQYPDHVERQESAYRTWAKRVSAQPWPMLETSPGERNGGLGLPEYLKTDRE
jgi:arylsulfatase